MKKKFLLFIYLFAVNFFVLEAAAYGFAILYPNLYRLSEAEVSENIASDEYRRFLNTVFDPLTGWENLKNSNSSGSDCEGRAIALRTDRYGARFRSIKRVPKIITVGDSFTFGHEANNDESFPSRLEELLGRGVVNYGVGAFGPLQAVLQFEKKSSNHGAIDTAILGIMYENILRMPNSYRPAFRSNTSHKFGFKPFVEVTKGEPKEIRNPNYNAVKTLAEFRALIEKAIVSDYWRKPEAKFPYTISFFKVMFGGNSSRLLFEEINSVLKRPRYAHHYEDKKLQNGIRFVVKKFVTQATKRGIRPVVVFIPRNKLDISSPRNLVVRLRQENPQALLIDVGRAKIEWNRFNLKGYICHPSPYGYNAIAQYIAEFLR